MKKYLLSNLSSFTPRFDKKEKNWWCFYSFYCPKGARYFRAMNKESGEKQYHRWTPGERPYYV